jgi:hypothetical protein
MFVNYIRYSAGVNTIHEVICETCGLSLTGQQSVDIWQSISNVPATVFVEVMKTEE